MILKCLKSNLVMNHNPSPLRLAARWVAALALLWLLMICGCKQASSPLPPPEPGAAVPAEAADQPQHLPTTTIRLGGRELAVEVARTEEQRRKGMMFRRSLGPDELMLFVFERSGALSFWMKNTLVDLDLAYIVEDGRIAQIEHMKAQNLNGVPSEGPARFVLEAPAGWFAAHRLGVGDTVELPPEISGR
jgi:uncharacterized protein